MRKSFYQQTNPRILWVAPTVIKGNEDQNANFTSTSRSTPAQDKLTAEIDQMTKKIEAHKASLESGMTEDTKRTSEMVRSLTEKMEKSLKRKLLLQKEAERKKKARLVKKKKVEELMEKRPEIAKELSCLTTIPKLGRPTFAQNDDLLHTIQEIAILGCGSDDRRRSETIRLVRTLDDLREELKKHGFTLIKLYFCLS